MRLPYIFCVTVVVELLERLKKKRKKIEDCFPNLLHLLSLHWRTEKSVGKHMP